MKAILGNAYSAQGIMASAQRCVNLYCERNPEDAPFPTTHYLTPGLLTVATAAKAGWRGLYVASSGNCYGVVNNTVVRIKPTGSTYSITVLGQLTTMKGPVSMVDNSLYLVVVDGSVGGYVVNLETDVFALITDPGFYGADKVDLLDGYLILNRPGTNQFYISDFLGINFDGLDFAAKTGFSDLLIGVGATKRQLFLFGALTTEVWFNSGDADFTFSRMPGAFIQHGCVSAATIHEFDGSLYWLSTSAKGEYMVMRTEGYDRARKSTFAVEAEFAKYAKAQHISDATAYIYQQNGHVFYILNFPSANKTWAYDISADMWQERVYSDDQGSENRQRGNCHAYFNGDTLVGDWESGKLYRMDSSLFTDDGQEIRRIRSFPHMEGDGNRMKYTAFRADMQTGEGVANGFPQPELRLRWSDTRGRSWGTFVTNTLAPTGDFLHSCMFQRLGMARDRVFELSWSANCTTQLNGAFVATAPAGS